MNFRIQLSTLREKVPVGISHGIALLNATNGNIEAAVEMFRQDAVAIVRIETSSSTETAEKYLNIHNFDTALAVKSIRDDRKALEQVPPDRIPFKIMNLLRSKSTQNVWAAAAEIAPTGQNPRNRAWIAVKACYGSTYNKGEIVHGFQYFQVEYIELSESYHDFIENHHSFLIKTENYYNIQNKDELEQLLLTWLDNLSNLTDLRAAGHPYY